MASRIRFTVIFALVAVTLGQHRWIEGGPCKKDDTICMCEMGVKYTNELRAKAGVPALEAGSMYMCKNAVDWSRGMGNGAGFDHQPIGRGVTVGDGTDCEATLSAENIAQNNVPRSEPTDPVKLCMEQWRKSSGHYANIIRSGKWGPVNTVVGVYIGSDNRIWCTQTFSRKRAGSTGMCKKAVMGGTMTPPKRTPTPTPMPMGPLKHTIMYLVYNGGKKTSLRQKCTASGCVFCLQWNLNRCFDVAKSKALDEALLAYEKMLQPWNF